MSTTIVSSGSYSRKNDKAFAFVSGYNPNITTFLYDKDTGDLRQTAISDGGDNPSWLAWHPSKKWMYAANERMEDSGLIVSFTVNKEDGSLKTINRKPSGGQFPCHVSVHKSGRYLFSANYGDGNVGVLTINPNDGSVSDPVIYKAGENAHMAITDSSGKYLLVPCLGSDHVAQYVFEENTGALVPNNPPSAPLPKGSGPRHLVFHPNGKYVYVINELGSTVAGFEYCSESGTLSNEHIQIISTLPEGENSTDNSAAELCITNDGKFLYGTNRGHNSVVIYQVDESTGKLTLVGWETGAGSIKIPRGFTLDTQSKFAHVASRDTNNVIVFRINQQDGKLEKISSVGGVDGPVYVGIVDIAED